MGLGLNPALTLTSYVTLNKVRNLTENEEDGIALVSYNCCKK